MSTHKPKKKDEPKIKAPVQAEPKRDTAEDLATTISLKEESLRWLFSIICAILVYVVAAKAVIANYHPDVQALEKAANEMFFDVGIIRPEPVEAALFRMAVLMLFPSLIGFYALFSRTAIVKKLTGDIPYAVITACCTAVILAIGYIGMSAPNPFGPKGGGHRPENNRDVVSATNFDFYFKGLFIENHVWGYVLFLVPLIALLFFVSARKKNVDKLAQKIIAFVGYPLMAFAVITIVMMNTISFPYTDENKFDFNGVYYSMTQVFAGLPMLVDGFVNTYGLYPMFLNPIFKIIGLSVFKFSLIMSLLLGAAFVLNFLFLKSFVRNRIILFLGFASLLFFPYLDFKLLTIFDCVFSLFPIRYMVPSILCCLAAWYFSKRTARLYWVTFFSAAFLLLWNPEIGLVSYLSWVFSNVYFDYYSSEGKVAIKQVGKHLAAGAGVLFVTFWLYKLVVLVIYGSMPDMSLMFATMQHFGRFGVGALPMALRHPWNLSVLVMLLGFMYAVSAWYNKAITVRSTIMLLVSLIAVGYFVYYQGRSQNSNYALSSSFTWVLLILLVDELWEKARQYNVLLFYFAFVASLIVLSFSFFEIAAESKHIYGLIYQEEDRKAHLAEQNQMESEMEFILSNTVEHEKIFMFTVKKYQCLFFDNSKRMSSFNPGLMDMFLRTDLGRMEQSFIDSSAKIFMARNMKAYTYFLRSAATIAANYEVKKKSTKMAMLEKRKRRIPSGYFFTGRDQKIIHRKYGDDTAGMTRRINDADSIGTVNLDSAFSVEALFFTSPQAMEFPVVIGNMNDSVGFAIGKMITPELSYYMGVNGKGVNVVLRPDSWIYVAMNISPGTIEVYINGARVTKQRLPEPMRKSTLPVRVGAFKNYNYFIGAIAEVAVSNKHMDSVLVSNTWDRINRSLPQN